MKMYRTSLSVFLSFLLVSSVSINAEGSSDSPEITSPSEAYLQTFQDISNIGNSGLPWTQGETIPGYYVYLGGLPDDEIGVPPIIARNKDGKSTGTLRFYCFTKEDHRSVGFATGSSTRGAYLALRLVNDSSETIQTITLSYTGHEWFDGVARPKQVGVSFTLSDPADFEDVTISDFLGQDPAGRWSLFDGAGFDLPVTDETGDVDPMGAGKVEVSATQKFLDWKPGTALWLRWDFGSAPTGFRMSIDDIKVTFSTKKK